MTEKLPPLDRSRAGETQTEVPDTPEDTPQPVEIELTAEEIAAAPPADPAQPEPPVTTPPPESEPEPERRKKAPAHVRVQRAVERAEAAERLAEETLARAIAAEERIALADRTAVTNYEARVTGEVTWAQRRLEDAIKAGNAADQAKASADLAKWSGEVNSINAWKGRNPAPTEQTAPVPPPAPVRQPAPQPRPDAATQAWVDANQWFAPDSDDFDEDMHVEARDYAATLERRYQRAGTPEKIATKEYWAAIDKHVRGEFPDHPWPTLPQSGKAAPMSGGSAVAAASPASGGVAAPTPGKIVLTGEERKFAEGMTLLHPNGTPYTDREKWIAYHNGKKKAAADAAARKAAA